LDSLGRDMKKLKENVHAIQVGCQTCAGAHLDKECPLNEEVKRIEEVKYGMFGCSSPFNYRAKYRVGPLGYYTCIDNRPSFREKKPSLEELMNKHLEESTRRRAEMEEWLTKEFHAKTASEVNNSSFDQCKVVYTDKEAPLNVINEPHEEYLFKKKWMFDFEIDQLADEYELGIEKKGHMLDDIWGNCKKVPGDNTYWCGQSFIFVTEELMDALPLGRENESRFKEMIRKEVLLARNENSRSPRLIVIWGYEVAQLKLCKISSLAIIIQNGEQRSGESFVLILLLF
nr:hypothetical protein [Tanacetum cinerariifolium]